jgi:hypothetical protein
MLGWLLFLVGRSIADEPTTWKLPEAESQRWLARFRQVYCRAPGWSVTAQGNEFVIQRGQPAAMQMTPDNGPMVQEPLHVPAGESKLRLVLRFGPKMSMDEYDRLAAINDASEHEREQLRARYHLIKFDDSTPPRPDESKNVQEYREAAKKFPRQVLPDFYTPDYSIYYTHCWNAICSPVDKSLWEQWQGIEAQLIRGFGVYNSLVIDERTSGVGQFVADK